MGETFKPGAARALFFSTTAFAVSFAVWGLISALAPTFTQIYRLSATSKSLLIAVPVLLGSSGRLPAGMLADRFGGRRVYAALLVLSALPAVAVGLSTSYTQLLVLGLFLGLAGSTFPVGVGFTSKWFSVESQGTALGVYGMGNVGQSVAVFGAPLLVAYAFGGDWRPVFFIFAALALLWGVVFYLFARDAAVTARPKTFAENLGVLVYVFAAVAAFGLLMGCAWMPTFTVGALGSAAALGLGNGAVFKLVPQFFSKEMGTVTGLVGAFGGLGGFFPPLALGLIRDATGGYAWGFVFLVCFALACLAVHYFMLVRPGGGARALRAGVGGPQAALR